MGKYPIIRLEAGQDLGQTTQDINDGGEGQSSEPLEGISLPQASEIQPEPVEEASSTVEMTASPSPEAVAPEESGQFSFPLWAGIILAVLAVAACATALGALLRLRTVKKRAKKRVSDLSAVTSVTVGKLHQQGARDYQQDTFGVSDESMMATHGLLAAVADGMGGLENSDKVSVTAVQAVLDDFALSQGRGAPKELLLALTRRATRAVNELLGPENYRKSGSTLVLGLIRDGWFSYLSIGDSRVSLYRNGVLTQLNREHVYENELALQAVNGEITVQDALSDPKGGGLVSFLGMGQVKYLDLPAEPIRLFPGDKLILMTDGVYNALTDAELSAALDSPPEEAAEKLRAAIEAKAYSNQDNYTAVVIGCDSAEK